MQIKRERRCDGGRELEAEFLVMKTKTLVMVALTFYDLLTIFIYNPAE